jgi:hypothetical protein
MKKWAMVAAIAMMVAAPAAVFAAKGGDEGPVSCQSFAWTTTAASTSTTAWTNIPGLTLTNTLALGFSVQVSANFVGDPVSIRIQDTSIGGTFTLQPGTAVARPVGGEATSMAYTWVGSNPAEHSHTFTVQWMLRTAGGQATINRGDMTLLFEGAPTEADC